MLLFTLSELPVSTNQSLQAFRSRLIHTPQARRFRISATNSFKLQTIKYHQDILLLSGKPLKAEVNLYSNWLTKAGKIRKTDACNKEKLLLDSLFEALKIIDTTLDDSQIYQITINKIQSNTDRTEVRLELLC